MADAAVAAAADDASAAAAAAAAAAAGGGGSSVVSTATPTAAMGDAEGNLWEGILAAHAGSGEGDVAPAAGAGASAGPSASAVAGVASGLVVLGDGESGRSALLARLRGQDPGTLRGRGLALEYSYLDLVAAAASDQEGAQSRRVGVWQLQGVASAHLLKFAASATSLATTTFLIVLDGGRPWSLMEQLKRWLGVVEAHLASLLPQLRAGELAALQDRLAAEYAAVQKLQSSTADGGAAEADEAAAAAEPAPVVPLSANAGVRIVVALAKADALDAQERRRGFEDAHFEWVHAHLRSECLRYGASLVYTSAKTGTNTGHLRDLLAARIVRGDAALASASAGDITSPVGKAAATAAAAGPLPAALLRLSVDDRAAILAPAGADSWALCRADLADAARTLGLAVDADFEDAAPRAAAAVTPAAAPAADVDTVVAQGDQAFLQELHGAQQDQPASAAAAMAALSPAPSTPLAAAGGGGETLMAPGSATTGTPNPAALRTPVRAPSASQLASAPVTPGAPSPSSTTDHVALNSFFSSLINAAGTDDQQDE